MVENMILHEIFCVVSRFPAHFMLYRGKSISFGTVHVLQRFVTDGLQICIANIPNVDESKLFLLYLCIYCIEKCFEAADMLVNMLTHTICYIYTVLYSVLSSGSIAIYLARSTSLSLSWRHDSQSGRYKIMSVAPPPPSLSGLSLLTSPTQPSRGVGGRRGLCHPCQAISHLSKTLTFKSKASHLLKERHRVRTVFDLRNFESDNQIKKNFMGQHCYSILEIKKSVFKS